MLAAVVVLLRSLRLICGGHRAVALENLALRQQLGAFRRTVGRPQLRTRDRLFWVLLAKAWRDWRTALIVVQPDTVVRWHRQWLRGRWTKRSTPTRPGRPSTLGPFGHSSTRWPRRILSGELLESTGNWASWASRCRSGLSHGSCGDAVAHRHRPGERSWRITWPLWCRWTSSPCRPSPAACYSCSCCSPTAVAGSCTSRSPSTPRPCGPRNRSLKPFRTTRAEMARERSGRHLR